MPSWPSTSTSVFIAMVCNVALDVFMISLQTNAKSILYIRKVVENSPSFWMKTEGNLRKLRKLKETEKNSQKLSKTLKN